MKSTTEDTLVKNSLVIQHIIAYFFCVIQNATLSVFLLDNQNLYETSQYCLVAIKLACLRFLQSSLTPFVKGTYHNFLQSLFLRVSWPVPFEEVRVNKEVLRGSQALMELMKIRPWSMLKLQLIKPIVLSPCLTEALSTKQSSILFFL